VFATFGPRVPDPDPLARRLKNVELGRRGMDLMRRLDVVGELRRIESPTLVCVGELDPVTPVDAAREIVAAMPASVGRLEIIERVGHFPWLDDPDRYWPVIEAFVVGQTSRA
jgi:pimeloyl-ACP methyl ester carboxylesterase